jgi:uncharacterized iron-regulated protein
MNKLVTAALLVATASLAPAAAAQNVFDLEIGDPARSAVAITPALDTIVATRDGAEITPAEIADRLRNVRLLLIGESHTSMDFHRVQVQVLRALQASGRRVLVGLEMYPVTEQPSLDSWNDGTWTEEEFIANSEWYRHWSYNWEYYREIFEVAREGGSPMFALNAPRANVSAVRRVGFDALSEAERVGVPPTIDTDNADHLTLFKAYFGDDAGGTHGGMTDEQWHGMFSAQCTWDGAMAWNAVQNLEAEADDTAIMVVMVGSGHVAYGLGIARQAAAYFDGEVATLIPVPMHDSDGEPTTTVRASYADFIWGVPGETDPLYPSLGVSVSETEAGLGVLFADPDSLGGAAGITTGDRILTIDGWEVTDKPSYHVLLAAKRWGDSVAITVLRDEAVVPISIKLRRD